MKSFQTRAVVAALLFTFQIAQAALLDRGNGLVYDDDLDITWLADASLAKTSGYDADGYMTWEGARMWASGLSYGGVSGWRLPNAVPTQLNGYECLGSEMCHLFYTELGGKAGEDIRQTGNANLALFANIDGEYYWSGTSHPIDTDNAFDFRFEGGVQSSDNKLFPERPAWAVHDGDVAAIPEPSALKLALGGVLALVLRSSKTLTIRSSASRSSSTGI